MAYAMIRPRQKSVPTLADVIAVYREEYLPTKAASTQRSQPTLLRHIERDLGAYTLSELDRDTIQVWQRTLRARQYGAGTIGRYLHTLSGLLTVASRDLRWVDENVVQRVRKPTPPPGRDRVLSVEEQQRLFVAAQAHPRWLTVLLWLGLSTGARRNELRELRWEHVDLRQGVIRLVQTKNGQPRGLPLQGRALAELRAYHQGQKDGWVFPGESGRQPVYFEHRLHKVFQAAGITGMVFHDLRHTYATRLAMSGASTVEIAELLGHRTMQMVRRYVHINVEHLRGVQERMGHQFLEE